MRISRLIIGIVTLGMVLASAGQARADVIVFATGRTMSVMGYRVTGQTITVTLRQGGEATFDRSLVATIEPDEVPYPEAAPAVSAPSPTPVTSRPSMHSRPFAHLIETVSVRHGIDPALVHAVIEAESNYQPAAQSRVGARGLMQVMPGTARELGVKSARLLFDPAQNVEAGVKYLKSLLDRFDGDLPIAIAAYNAGPAAVAKYDGIPPYPETRHYVRKVLSNLQH